jgi:NADH-quinone oxidoreductase subunit B/C/D
MWSPPARYIVLGENDKGLARVMEDRFGQAVRQTDKTSDMLTLNVEQGHVQEVLRFLKNESAPKFKRLDDLTAIDESARRDPGQYPDYTLVYHLLSFEPAGRIRLKVALNGKDPECPSVTDIWPSANWYEREVFDLFGIRFKGHPNLQRILMPHDWQGHPLRKSYPGRATEMPPYTLEDARQHQPLDGGVYLPKEKGDHQLILNMGPHHVSVHGLIRYIVALEGEEITELDMEIGYHHRAAEKIGERQTWHQYINPGGYHGAGTRPGNPGAAH